MKKLFKISILGLFLCSNLVFAQSFEQNTTYIAKKLTELNYDKDEDATPKFSFKGCQMNMDVRTNDDDVKFGMRLSWQLKDVRHINYSKNKDGFYKFSMDLPVDKVKMKLGFGDENSLGGSFKVSNDDKENDSKTSFDLKTTDEKIVKDLAFRLDSAAKTCKNSK